MRKKQNNWYRLTFQNGCIDYVWGSSLTDCMKCVDLKIYDSYGMIVCIEYICACNEVTKKVNKYSRKLLNNL